MLHLDPKEFTVEPSTLQSLQQLIQWVADLALNLLVRLPEQRMQTKSSGVSFLFSIYSFQCLAETRSEKRDLTISNKYRQLEPLYYFYNSKLLRRYYTI